ncbi:hypothetical protein JCM6882_005719 [Rhodosporidiobolus microsporus]
MAFRANSLASEKPNKTKEDLAGQVTMQKTYEEGDVEANEDSTAAHEDGVFGAQGGSDTVQYRSLGWIWTGFFLTKSMIGLGVLTIPFAFQTLGLVPGILVILVVAAMTLWTDIYVGLFKCKHPEVYSLADAGRLIFGRAGSITFGIAYWLFCTFVAGSAFVGISTAFNAITMHGTCTVVFVLIAMLVALPFAMLPKLADIKWLSYIGLMSIVPAILLVTIAVGAGERPASAPQSGPLDLQIKMFNTPTFADAMSAVANIVFAFAGTPVFLPIASEMRRPADFWKSVILCQSFCTAFYLAVSITVYLYAGVYVASPALGTAGVLIKRVAYGLALPGLWFTAIIYVHLPAKVLMVRMLRGSHHLAHKTRKHWITWFSCTIGCACFSYVIAEAIPVFGGLVGLIGALFGTLLTFHAEASMYLFDIWAAFRDPKTRTFKLWCGVIGNVALIIVGSFLMVGGAYGSIVSIKNSYAAVGGTPFSCADNSNSV